jgi:hypothetical protein
MSRVTDPNQVRLTGENSFITLHSGENGPVTLKASHWRVLVSPFGPGHALFLKGDLTGDKARVYADNLGLARWLQQEARQVGSDQKDPVIQSAFTRSGDTMSSWTEIVRSDGDVVVLSWYDLGEPFIFRSDPGSRPGIVHGVYSLLIPARKAEVSLNDKLASGIAIPEKIDERASSSACLALSETWLKPY